MEKKKKEKTLEDGLYNMGLCMMVVIFLCAVVVKLMYVRHISMPCVFLSLTGLYCPGCGGTRAFKSLAEGDILNALWYHPFVVYAAVIYGWFMISHTIERLTKGRFRGMKYRNGYLYIWLFILVANFILRNVLKIVYNITL